jgi:hypothetical protein
MRGEKNELQKIQRAHGRARCPLTFRAAKLLCSGSPPLSRYGIPSQRFGDAEIRARQWPRYLDAENELPEKFEEIQ